MTKDERYALAVDLGTGGPKVGLVSLHGSIAWQDHIPVATRWLDGGGAVQDAGQWWSIVADATQRAMKQTGLDPGAVVAVSVTGQWASTVPVDGEGVPVSDCVMWMDTRGGAQARKVIGGPMAGYGPGAARWLRRAGVPPSGAGDDSFGHMLYLGKERPDVALASRWYLEPVDYLSMRFSGVAAATPGSMTAAWLTDNRSPDITDYDPTLLRRSGVDVAKLPPLRPPCSVIGRVKPEVAAELGIGPDAVVVTGSLDLHSAAVGSGAVEDFEAHLAISTTSWISCPVLEKKTDIVRQLATVPGLTADRYLIVNNQDSAGRCLEWYRDALMEGTSFAQLDRLAASAPAGSGGLIFTPWLIGERSPVADRHARGGFHNLSVFSDRAAMTRAVLEGVAYNLRWLLEGCDHFTGQRLDPIRIIGGGARSDLWCQIVADVTGRRIERPADPLHANLRGAALMAGMALGDLKKADIRPLVALDGTFEPQKTNRAVYDRLFAEFPRLYKAQKRMFARLNRKAPPQAILGSG